jgi:hypothetical protein
MQGDLRWEAQRTGDPSRDWPLLQAVSCANPNVFWAAVAKELGLQQGLLTPPSCMLQEQHSEPDKARWLPGGKVFLLQLLLQLWGVLLLLCIVFGGSGTAGVCWRRCAVL